MAKLKEHFFFPLRRLLSWGFRIVLVEVYYSISDTCRNFRNSRLTPLGRPPTTDYIPDAIRIFSPGSDYTFCSDYILSDYTLRLHTGGLVCNLRSSSVVAALLWGKINRLQV